MKNAFFKATLHKIYR